MTAIYAVVGGGAAIVPLYLAATAGWHRLIDFHDQHTDRTSERPIRTGQRAIGVAPIPQPRQPYAALAAVAYQPVTDEHLGELIVGPLAPACIHDELTGATR